MRNVVALTAGVAYTAQVVVTNRSVKRALRGDINGDGFVDMGDITALEQIILGLDTTPPAPDAKAPATLSVLLRLVVGTSAPVDIGPTTHGFLPDESKSIAVPFTVPLGSGGQPGSMSIFVLGEGVVLSYAEILFDIITGEVTPTPTTVEEFISAIQAATSKTQLTTLHDLAVQAYFAGQITYDGYLRVYDAYVIRWGQVA